MKWNYAIFQKLPDDRMCWVTVVERLKKAKQRLKELRGSSTAQYCTYDLRTMEMVAPWGLARGHDRARRRSSAASTPEGGA